MHSAEQCTTPNMNVRQQFITRKTVEQAEMVKTKESSKLWLLLSVMFDSTPISEFLISINVSLLPSVL